MVNTKFISTEDMINKLQSLKRKTNLEVYEKLRKYYDERILKILDSKKILLLKMLKMLVKVIMKYYY